MSEGGVAALRGAEQVAALGGEEGGGEESSLSGRRRQLNLSESIVPAQMFCT